MPFSLLQVKRGVVLGVVAIVAALAVLSLFRSRNPGSTPPASPPSVVAESPFQNVRAGVAYVGDAACTRCHRAIAESYRNHPMGRSLGPVAEESASRPAMAGQGASFEAHGFTYTVETQGDQVIHRERKRDGAGQVITDIAVPVAFALGSGTRGVSYLWERDGYVFQSPISWYSQEEGWDLAPGYGRDNPHFGRPIDPDCLFCHANQVEPVAGTEFRYKTPIFAGGHAVGCERCHGPGALHVENPGSPGAVDTTIVNPVHLDPIARESVCQQCHALGLGRFPRADRNIADYRPGLRIQDYLAVFEKTATDDFRAVGHVAQMKQSGCFQGTKGQLGCISCHDPHRSPAPDEKVSFYRGRCLECHDTRPCTETNAKRQAVADDCARCHMPRQSLSNIAHTAASDHRILRRPDAPRPAPPARDTLPLADLFADQMTPAERQAAGRDIGVALIRVGQTQQAPQALRQAGTLALPFLEVAAKSHPNDLLTLESQATALGYLGRFPEARKVVDSVLAVAPSRESALRLAAQLAIDQRDLAAAREYWQRLVAANPLRAEWHFRLAGTCDALHDWKAAIDPCLAALKLNPASTETRSLLVRSYLATGQTKEAQAAFDTLAALNPAGRVVWEEWFRQQQAQFPPAQTPR